MVTSFRGRPLRVVHVVQCGPTTGGTVSHVMTQAKHQKSLGVQVAVCAASEGLLADTCRKEGIPVFVEPLLNAQTGEKTLDPGYEERVTEVLGTFEPDLLHAHLRYAGFASQAASRRLGVPMIYTQHMGDTDPFLAAQSLSGAHMPIITVSRWVHEKTASYVSDPERIHYIPNGVDVPQNLGLSLPRDDRPNVLFCGRLVADKGADVAILALAALRDPDTPLPRLHIAGIGPEEPLLRRLAHSTGLSGDVFFHGSVPQAIHRDSGADVVVVPSRAEPCGLVIMEAMSSEIRLVASDVGGIPEMIRPGIDGQLVEPDNPAALAAAIRHTLIDPSDVLVKSARVRYEESYTARLMAERTVAAYLNELEGAAPNRQ